MYKVIVFSETIHKPESRKGGSFAVEVSEDFGDESNIDAKIKETAAKVSFTSNEGTFWVVLEGNGLILQGTVQDVNHDAEHFEILEKVSVRTL
jgi:hypothetical protein